MGDKVTLDCEIETRRKGSKSAGLREGGATSVVSLANPLVAAIQRKDRDAEEWWFFNHTSASSKDHDLASQVRRALSSVGLNLAEAFGAAAGNVVYVSRPRVVRYTRRTQASDHGCLGVLHAAAGGGALVAMDALGGRVYGLARR